MDLLQTLLKHQDKVYGDFNHKLSPTLPRDHFIGVRVPVLRQIAKEYNKDPDHLLFMKSLPHTYFEENMMHCLLITLIKDYDTCIQEINAFLPYVDNWAVCDTMSNKMLKKHHDKLIQEILKWIESNHPYTIRFGILMLMSNYLEDDFKEEYIRLVSSIQSEEYYVNMMRAWFFATALAKQWKATIPLLETNQLDKWTHNKTIQKGVESYRISNEQKEYLKTLRRK